MDNFTISDPNLINETLNRYGVCVITDILTTKESEKLFNCMVWDLETRTSCLETPFRLNKPETWSTLEVFNPYHNMLYQNSGIAHAGYIWNLRTHPKVVNVFEIIWSSKKLITSFDGISFHLPGEMSGKKHFCEDEKPWYHVDQSPFRNTFDCVQGFVTSKDVNEHDATLSVIVGSHKHYSEYFDNEINKMIFERASKETIDKKMKVEFQKINDISYFLKRGCYEHKIICPAGSLVLWDSRTVHFGTQPSNKRTKLNFRSIVYISMSPIEKISEYKFSSKIFTKRSYEYFTEQKTTGHNAFLRRLSRSKPKVNLPMICPIKPTQQIYSMITGDYV